MTGAFSMRRATFAGLFAVAIALLAVACGTDSSTAKVPPDSVAVVGDRTISKSEYDDLVSYAKRNYSAQKRTFPKVGTQEYAQIRDQAVRFLVQRAQFEVKADDLDIDVSDKAVDKRIDQYKQERHKGSDEKFREELKQQGRIRYIGVTTTFDQQYSQIVDIMKREPLDFIGIDYAVDNREVETTILPLAQERKIGVMAFFPFGNNGGISCGSGLNLFGRVGNRPLPEWAAEFDAKTWAQFFLKYVISHPAVTVAPAPGLGQAEGVAERGRGVGVLDHVVGALGPRRVAGEAAEGAQVGEVVLAAGDQLVHVGLVAGVPDDPVDRRVEGPVEGDGELDDAEVGAEVTAADGNRPDQEVPDLGGQLGELVVVELPQVARLLDRFQHDDSRIWGFGCSCLLGTGAYRNPVPAWRTASRSWTQPAASSTARTARARG